MTNRFELEARVPYVYRSDDTVSREVNATGTGLPLDLPTGSGFYSLQAGLTWLYPTDPAVLFGNFSYLHNFKRTVSRNLRDGTRESLGEIRPGSVLGFNFGMGLAINDKSSFRIGYDNASVGKTRRDGDVVPGSVRTQLATLLVGYSYRLIEKRSIGLSVGAGLTRDTTLTVRMPMTF